MRGNGALENGGAGFGPEHRGGGAGLYSIKPLQERLMYDFLWDDEALTKQALDSTTFKILQRPEGEDRPQPAAQRGE